MEQLKRRSYSHQLQHATGRNSICFRRRRIWRKYNPCQECQFLLNKCKSNLDPNTRSLNLNMHCPGKLKVLEICPDLRMPLKIFICLPSFFFPHTSFSTLNRRVQPSTGKVSEQTDAPVFLTLCSAGAQQGWGVQCWLWNISNHSSKVRQSSPVKAHLVFGHPSSGL